MVIMWSGKRRLLVVNIKYSSEGLFIVSLLKMSQISCFSSLSLLEVDQIFIKNATCSHTNRKTVDVLCFPGVKMISFQEKLIKFLWMGRDVYRVLWTNPCGFKHKEEKQKAGKYSYYFEAFHVKVTAVLLLECPVSSFSTKVRTIRFLQSVRSHLFPALVCFASLLFSFLCVCVFFFISLIVLTGCNFSFLWSFKVLRRATERGRAQPYLTA